MPRPKLRFRLTGFDKAAHQIELLAAEGGEQLVSGLRVIGEEIMTDVQAARPGEGVPVDEGTLRDSGVVTGPDEKGSVRLTFGGAAAPYALRQHEELQYRHTVGEARYLVRGVERWSRGDRPADALKKMVSAAIAKVAARKRVKAD